MSPKKFKTIDNISTVPTRTQPVRPRLTNHATLRARRRIVNHYAWISHFHLSPANIRFSFFNRRTASPLSLCPSVGDY